MGAAENHQIINLQFCPKSFHVNMNNVDMFPVPFATDCIETRC